MLILTLRTDKPEAEIGLFDNDKQLVSLSWEAHRKLAETLHLKLKEVLDTQNLTLNDLQGCVVFKGPGSFTGLRIGISVANAIADSLNIPIAGETGDQWAPSGIHRLKKGEEDNVVLPEYGSPPHITKPKH